MKPWSTLALHTTGLPPSLHELVLVGRLPLQYYHMRYSDAREPNRQVNPIGVADLTHLTALTSLTLHNTEGTGPSTDLWHLDGSSALEVSLPAVLVDLCIHMDASRAFRGWAVLR